VQDSEFSHRAQRRLDPRYAWGLASLVLGAALGIGAYALLQPGGNTRVAVASTVQPSAISNYAEKEILTAVAPEAGPVAATVSAAGADRTAIELERNVSERSQTMVEPQLPMQAMGGSSAQTTAASSSAAAPTGARQAETPAQASPVAAAARKGNGAGEDARTDDTDSLEARLAATQHWLSREAPGTYSIQLLGTEKPEQLKEHLKVISKSIEINKIFVYRTIAKEKPSLTVLYGSFNDFGDAKAALKSLPKSLKAYRPILRTVQGIQGEIRRHQVSGLVERPNS